MATTSTLKGDIPIGNWIDRWMPSPLRPYLRLMRLDRPIGTWLLLFPGWWSVAMAAGESGWPDWFLMACFGLGAMIMRGAGCVFNDIADAEFDGRVERTRARPIPSGQVSRRQAAAFMAFLMLLGLAILLQFNPFAMAVGAASLFLIFTYPFMKRITYWPQAWLGLTFNWGALLGWACVRGQLDLPAYVLYAAGFFWTLGYDTIYAHMDKEDDVLIGVKSTALRLGNATRDWLVGFYALTLSLIALAGWLAGLAWPFFALLLPAAAHLVWQHRVLKIDDPKNCLFLFRANRFFGWIVLVAMIAGNLAR